MLDYTYNATPYFDPSLTGSYDWWMNLNKSIDYNKNTGTKTSTSSNDSNGDAEKEKLRLIEEAKEAYKTQLTSSVVNLVGNVADLGTNKVSSDMVFNEGVLKFSQMSRILDNTPFGPAAKLGRFGFNSIAKGISTEINNFDFDPDVEARMGSAYNFKKFNDLKKTNNKSALFWETDDYNKEKFNASKLYTKIASIDSDQQARLSMYNNVNQNLLNYNAKINGGINIPSLGKKGLKFDLVKRAKKIKSKINLNTKQIEEFEHGGFIPEITEFCPIIVDDDYVMKKFQKGGKTNKYKDVYDFYNDYDLSNINIIEGNEAKTEGNNIYITNDEDLVHELHHYVSQNKPNEIYKEFYDNLNNLRILELGGNLQFINRTGDPSDFYHPSELEARIKAAKYRTSGLSYTKDFFRKLRNNPEKFGYNMRDLLYMYNDENLEKIFNLKKGGSIKESEELVKLEETNQKNVIPEGALHKNKHHIEHTEGLTQKGIPVIDNDGDLQAEIELDEIIFTLEVTKKLEKLHKIFKEGSNKEKDEAAIEAGKLLVQEILYNTDDRTGLISKCLKGGKI